jgi:Na+-transporting methylmalonyl-CoA/oxaloacetate decarboxylase gamma subunit
LSEELILALQVTVVGMGLVFTGILLLWASIALLTRLTRPRLPRQEAEEEAGAPAKDQSLKVVAASAAVALALAQREKARSEPQLFPLPQTALVTAWQAVTRASRLSSRGRLK